MAGLSDIYNDPNPGNSAYSEFTPSGGSDWGSAPNLASMLGSNFNDMGYKGQILDQDPNSGSTSLNQGLISWLQNNGYKLNGSALDNGSQATLTNAQNKPVAQNSFQYSNGLFGGLIDAGVAGLSGGAFGPGAALGLGSTASGALGGALSGGIIGGGQGGNPFTSALTGGALGGLGGAISGQNPAGMLGMDKGPMASAVNSGISGTTQSLLRGNPLLSSVTQGLTNAGTSGLNSMGQSILPSFMDNIFGQSQQQPLQAMMGNPEQNASYPSNYVPPGQELRNNILGTEMPQQSWAAPSSPLFTGNNTTGSSMAPQQQAQGMQSPLASLFSGGGQTGGKTTGGLGDLAMAAYGFYNNNKQQQRMQQMMGGLSGLYNQNGAYANQMRSNLERQAAAKGTRSDTGGREQALMADLASHNAALMPSMYQMQGGMNTLQNNQMMNAMNTFRNMGGINGLRSLFSPQDNSFNGPPANLAGN